MIYTECDYKGESYKVCKGKEEKNISKDEFGGHAKSIKVPEGYALDVYTDEDFKGKKTTYTED